MHELRIQVAIPLAGDAMARAKDVAAFIAWTSEPKMVERKQAGLGVMIYLLLFAGITYVAYRRIWKGVAH